ncbi:hypothetical protein D3C72_2570140 [compost metagenome]
MWLVWLGKTISAMRTSVGGTVSGMGVMGAVRVWGETDFKAGGVQAALHFGTPTA